LSKISLQDRIDLDYLSEITKDKSGADIKEICNQAAVNAFKRESGTKERKFCVSTEDLAKAIADFIPLQRLDFDS
jgi:ATP-dependent 26S proteasome regulatory subunit